MTHRERIAVLIEDENLEALTVADTDHAVEQLNGGELWSDVQRRLRDWNHDALLDARCEGLEADRLEGEYR